MANLQNLQISDTYDGLIKTNDENAITGTLKGLQDGAGNNLPMEVSTTGVNFTGTVTGIPTPDGLAPAGGTANQVLTKVDATDYNYSWQDAQGGGGGGTTLGLHNTTRGIVLDNSVVTNSKFMWRVTYNSDSYATSTFTVNANTLYCTAMSFAEGELVNRFGVYVRTAGATLKAAIYSAQYDANGNIEPGLLLYDFGQIDTSTTGLKVIANANYTLGTTVENTYFLCLLNDSATATGVMAVSTTQLSGPIYHASMYATTSYRGNTYHTNTGGTLPADLTPYTFSTTAAFPQYGVAR